MGGLGGDSQPIKKENKGKTGVWGQSPQYERIILIFLFFLT